MYDKHGRRIRLLCHDTGAGIRFRLYAEWTKTNTVEGVSFPAWPTSAGPALQWVFIILSKGYYGRSQRPRGLRLKSAVARLLGLWVRIPPGAWMFVSCDCCVLSGRGLCVRPITWPEESYRVWSVWVWSWILGNEEVFAHWGLLGNGKKKFIITAGVYGATVIDCPTSSASGVRRNADRATDGALGRRLPVKQGENTPMYFGRGWPFSRLLATKVCASAWRVYTGDRHSSAFVWHTHMPVSPLIPPGTFLCTSSHCTVPIPNTRTACADGW